MKAYAICDRDVIMERSGTGQLCIFYSLDDAREALPTVKKLAPADYRNRLKIRPVTIQWPRR